MEGLISLVTGMAPAKEVEKLLQVVRGLRHGAKDADEDSAAGDENGAEERISGEWL